jgi:hypothetical protein
LIDLAEDGLRVEPFLSHDQADAALRADLWRMARAGDQ